MQLTKITIPFDVCKAGGSSENLFNFVYNWILAGYKQEREGTDVVLRAVIPKLQPEFEDLVAIVTGGGSFEGVKCGIRINQAQFNADVPAGVPNATYQDEEETTVQRTWTQWAKAGNIDYTLKQDNTDAIMKAVWNGKLLDSDDLKAIHNSTGVTVLGWDTFITDLKSTDYTPAE